MHVVDMIFFWAKARPHYPAIIQTDIVISYEGMAEAIISVSARIGQLNLDPHKPVAVSIEHPAKQLVVTFALLYSGLTPAPVFRALLPFLRGAGIDNMIYASEGQVLSGGRNIRFEDSWLPRESTSSKITARGRNGVYPDMIFFSSGTTGMPKKYIQTCEGFIERQKTTVLRENDEISRALVIPGVSSSFGFNHACEMLHTGKTVCFSLPGETMLVLMSTYRIEAIVASPQQALGLVDLIEKGAGQYQLNSLKSVRLGGGSVSRNLVRRIQASLCPQVTVIYGSTEAGNMAFASYDAIANTPNAVGYVPPWVQVEIVDNSGAIQPPEVEGYIRCRTPIYMKHFAANNPDTKIDARDVWWYPGDLGRLTRDGMLCVSGRSSDVIDRGGHKVSAAALDEVLVSCSGVKDAGVCGVMGNSGINEIWIGIVPETTIHIARLKQDLEGDEKFNTEVDEILIVDSIPRNELGKIKRHELREMLLGLKKNPSPQ
jgi:acyl-coenzyme A synthetase/AMP-(fatty) acid ligase